jgi:hypothetical protein
LGDPLKGNLLLFYKPLHLEAQQVSTGIEVRRHQLLAVRLLRHLRRRLLLFLLVVEGLHRGDVLRELTRPLEAEALVALRDEEPLLELALALSLLTRDGRRRRRERFRMLLRLDIVEVHRATGAAEAPGDHVVGAHRLVPPS